MNSPRHWLAYCVQSCGWPGNQRTGDEKADVEKKPCPRCGGPVEARKPASK